MVRGKSRDQAAVVLSRPQGTDGGRLVVDPACIVGAADLEQEFRVAYQAAVAEWKASGETYGGDLTSDQRVGAQVIERDRACLKWFPYQPGLGPREHVEAFRVIQIEEQRKAHDLQLAGIEVESRRVSEQIQRDSLEIAKATKATMDGLQGIATKTDDFQTTWTRWAVAIAIGALVIVAAQYLSPGLGPQIMGWVAGFFGH
jgi:hypothetical protein